jgi:hypothetical protein
VTISYAHNIDILFEKGARNFAFVFVVEMMMMMMITIISRNFYRRVILRTRRRTRTWQISHIPNAILAFLPHKM